MRRAAAVAALATLAAVASASTPARGAPLEIGGFVASASASGVRMIFDSLDNPIPVHPSLEGSGPYAEVQHSGAPAARALASLAWPGPTIANGGTAAEQFGFPPGVIPNYPVRAEALSPQGPETVRSAPAPGSLMEATAREAETAATASNDDAGSSAAAVASSAKAQARTVVDNRGVFALATSLMTDVSILGGLLTIDVISTRVEVDTNGRRTAGTTRVGGIAVAGVKIHLDEQGVSVGPNQQPRPTDAVIDPIERQLLSQAGFKLTLARPEVEKTPTRLARSTAGLIVSWRSPDGRQSWMLALGAARAEVSVGAPAHALNAGEAGVGAPALGTAASEEKFFPALTGSPAPGPESAFEAPASGVGRASTTLRATAFGTAVGTGLVALALLLVLAAARGLTGLSTVATSIASPRCPEGDAR